jgi:hypothetical protein
VCVKSLPQAITCSHIQRTGFQGEVEGELQGADWGMVGAEEAVRTDR